MNIKKLLVSTGAGALMLAASMVPVFADSYSANFETPTFTVGNINAQDGWMKTGTFDVAVVSNTYGIASFGSQSLRLSDAVTSGSFGDQTFAKPLANAVGEVDSTDGAFSRGTIQQHFETQFDLASTMATEQAGMHISFSPDRGDGSRMSYLRFEDQADGIHIYFDDVQGTTNPANFVETDIATVSRTAHTIKLTMDMVDGPSNDVVKVYVDGVLKITGTSWENYYRFDSESSAEQSPRIVKTVLFRESGTATPANVEKGFLIDNLSTVSGPVLVGPPTDKDQCKKGGWKLFNNPTFKNQGKCVSYVERHEDDEHEDHRDNEHREHDDHDNRGISHSQKHDD